MGGAADQRDVPTLVALRVSNAVAHFAQCLPFRVRCSDDLAAGLDWADRNDALGQNQLAKSLHAMIASHTSWMPIRLDMLMARVGAQVTRMRDFKAALETVLDDFKVRGWIHSYSIGTGDRGLVAIDKVRTPTQDRALKRLQAESDPQS